MELQKEYIDVEDAVKRVGGNMDLFKRLLAQFMGGDHFQKLDEALDAGETEAAARLAHTLKGTGANLSLHKLSAAAAELEQNIKNGIDHTESLANLKQIFDATSNEAAKIP
ncbi:MAG: Hpt domain-containing protein [Oscillospiraceae bacterium]|nr:Hpt domain-containing protein [Oscillospiraceae bacterium]